MKLRIFLCSVFLFLGMGTIKLFAEENLDVWKYAYQADYNFTHKKILSRDYFTVDQIVVNHLIWSYYYYRKNDNESMYNIFKDIDQFIEVCLLYDFTDKDRNNTENNSMQ